MVHHSPFGKSVDSVGWAGLTGWVSAAESLDIDALPLGEYAFPGPLRDKLVAAILSGEKTATAGLAEEYRRCDEPLPQVGDLEAVVDSAGHVVCVTRTTAVDLVRLGDVNDEHAHREGEGYATAADWRRGHEAFWTSSEYVTDLGEPAVELDDDTVVVCTTFEVIQTVPPQ